MEKKSTQMLMDTFQSKESHGIKQEHHFRCAKAQIREDMVSFLFHHDTRTHCVQKHDQVEGSSNC